MERRSRFEYGEESFETSLPAKAWTPIDATVGGRRRAASGVAAAYVVRRDALLDLPLRLEESEWIAFLTFLAFAQTGQSFTWFPDAEEPDSFTVDLESPAMGERCVPSRNSEYPRMFDVTITLRGVADSPWVEYFRP